MSKRAEIRIPEEQDRVEPTKQEILDRLDRLARQIAADWKSPRSAVELVTEQRR